MTTSERCPTCKQPMQEQDTWTDVHHYVCFDCHTESTPMRHAPRAEAASPETAPIDNNSYYKQLRGEAASPGPALKADEWLFKESGVGPGTCPLCEVIHSGHCSKFTWIAGLLEAYAEAFAARESAALTQRVEELERYLRTERGGHLVVCNANHDGPIGCDMCVCSPSRLWEKLQTAERQLKVAIEDAANWKRQFEMYRTAWLREIGGVIVNKSHEIDGFVLRTQQIYQQAGKWIAYENGVLLRDPFWMVPDSGKLAEEALRQVEGKKNL